jgi:hypothetical protein
MHVLCNVVLQQLYANAQYYFESLDQYTLSNFRVVHNMTVPGDMQFMELNFML